MPPGRFGGISETIVSQLSVACPPIPICIGPAAPAEFDPDSTPVPGPLLVPNVDSALFSAARYAQPSFPSPNCWLAPSKIGSRFCGIPGTLAGPGPVGVPLSQPEADAGSSISRIISGTPSTSSPRRGRPPR